MKTMEDYPKTLSFIGDAALTTILLLLILILLVLTMIKPHHEHYTRVAMPLSIVFGSLVLSLTLRMMK